VDDSGKRVIPDAVGGKTSPYEEFLEALPERECRYGGESAANRVGLGAERGC